MSKKERIYRNDNQTRSKQPAQQPAHKVSAALAHQPHRATLTGQAKLAQASLAAPNVLQLQSAIGNQAMGRLLSATLNVHHSQKQAVPRRAESPQGHRAALPAQLKAGIENLSGMAMDDVKVHYNSSKPAEVQAVAHTQGSHIHVAPGQEQHLPHEAWHVVQQKQGRVKSTGVLPQGAAINADHSLEREADQMGTQASQAGFSAPVRKNNLSPVSQTAPAEIMQRKKVPDTVGPDDFGQFETTQLTEYDKRGIEITLKFHPNENKVDAKKIALSQSVRKTNASGDVMAIDPTQAGRLVAKDKPGAGYAIDQLSDVNNPIYSENAHLGATQELKDTPKSANTTADATEVGVNTNYELGECYKANSTDAKKTVHPAGLWDRPTSGGKKGETRTFETTAFAIEGADKDKYYGSVKWGFKMEGTAATPTVKKMDIEPASKGTPTANFIEAAKLWNVGKTRGTIQVTADPEAEVQKPDGTKGKLAKGTKLKQLNAVMLSAVLGSVVGIEAEVLNADGTGSGKIIYIRQSDVKDMGDGSDTKKLPIPADKPAVKK